MKRHGNHWLFNKKCFGGMVNKSNLNKSDQNDLKGKWERKTFSIIGKYSKNLIVRGKWLSKTSRDVICRRSLQMKTTNISLNSEEKWGPKKDGGYE